jgi:single-strand DNA-binding protein
MHQTGGIGEGRISYMNKVILMGRLTRDPEMRYSSGENQTAIARYTLAVDRRFKRQGDEQSADFINCVVFGRGAEFAENYLHQGTKIVVSGRIQTGSYTNKEGRKVYTTEVVVEEQEFAESKASAANYDSNNGGYQQAPSRPEPTQAAGDGFMNIPDAIEEELPFN